MSGKERFSSDDLLRDLLNALNGNALDSEADVARLDYRRADRIGTPEIIYAENKRSEDLIDLAGRMLDRNGSVLLSRVSETAASLLREEFGDFAFEQPAGSSMVRIRKEPVGAGETSGRIGILTAGTSDLPRAQEVKFVAEEMGCSARIWADVGVAGIHRLIQPFREAIDSGVSVFVVVAGMDGALPSVVSGLSPIPVIGLPTSVGYGYGGQGEGPLMAMLQSCAPGLTVVNIDNSVGAGISAAKIARQSAIGT